MTLQDIGAEMVEKYCPSCNTKKSASEFYPRISNDPAGLLNDICKDCVRIKNHEAWVRRSLAK